MNSDEKLNYTVENTSMEDAMNGSKIEISSIDTKDNIIALPTTLSENINHVKQRQQKSLAGKIVGLKIDVDTERGTRIGVPNLIKILEKHKIQATFLYSMGPDKTGKAILRAFTPGFYKKVSRTNVFKIYGLKTLLNGLLFKPPHIAIKHGEIMRQSLANGHEVGVHCYEHATWQNKLHIWDEARIREEVNMAVSTFIDVFNFRPLTIGAAGWQANRKSLAAYEDQCLFYASDTRGSKAFFPIDKQKIFNTLQIPTTLPTLDELLGRPEYPMENLIDFYQSQIQNQSLNVLTIHAELEGMYYAKWFEDFLESSIKQGVQFVPLIKIANTLLEDKKSIPRLQLVQGEVEGRAGFLATHE